MINVTQTFLPPIEEYNHFLNEIWKSKWVTNRGPLVLELENKLKSYLDVNEIILTTNGTLPIQIAIKTLQLTGEIITTPFSYVATTSSIVWENCNPVFVDINPDYLTIDETKIEAAITEKTTAILATHVFGNPCDVEAIAKIAKKHNLKVIYDAAHCFGVSYNGTSIFNYGDVSTCSFHATKIFHTGEGGAMFANDMKLNEQLFARHNFGHKTAIDFECSGINAKMSELQAAMGLAILPHFQSIKSSRKKVVEYYLENLNFKTFTTQKIRENTTWNYHYFPIIFNSEEKLLSVVKKLNEKNIFPRRYFYPSLNTLDYVDKKYSCPISESISRGVLCLPLYVGIDIEVLGIIIAIVNE